LKTLFLRHAKGHDVAKKTVDMLEEMGFQFPLSGLMLGEISLPSDGPNVNETIWSAINKVLLDEGLPGFLPFIHECINVFVKSCKTSTSQLIWFFYCL